MRTPTSVVLSLGFTRWTGLRATAFLGAAGLATTLVAAQESKRTLDRPGMHTKHLTRDTVDEWQLTASAGEVLRVSVSSSGFDPVLELVRDDEEDRTVLVDEVDDDGSESRFLYRAVEEGKLAILVHGPERRGGGNYALTVERFSPRDSDSGRSGTAGPPRARGTFPRDGAATIAFAGRAGQIVLPVGGYVDAMIDPKGTGLSGWCGGYRLERDGEHYVRVRGRRGHAYDLQIRTARRREIGAQQLAAAPGFRTESKLDAPAMDVWVFDAEPGDFRMLELVAAPSTALRILHLDEEEDETTTEPRGPAMTEVEVHSKALVQRRAFVFNRAGRFEVQIADRRHHSTDYSLTLGDPTQTLAVDSSVDADLPVGGTRFYSFDAEAGHLLELGLSSKVFDPVLSIHRDDGTLFGADDDGGAASDSGFQFLVTEPGRYRVRVACFGNGGGGTYGLAVRDLAIPVIESGTTSDIEARGPGTTYYHFEGRAGRTVFVSVNAPHADAALAIYDPNGIEVGRDDDSGLDDDPLEALRLPHDGRYTIAIQTKSGRGTMRLQLIDPEAPD